MSVWNVIHADGGIDRFLVTERDAPALDEVAEAVNELVVSLLGLDDTLDAGDIDPIADAAREAVLEFVRPVAERRPV